MNKDRITALIEHYKTRKVPDWSYAHCVSGTLTREGKLTEGNYYEVAEYLEISPQEAYKIVYGPDDYLSGMHNVNQQIVLGMLEHLHDTGKVDWSAAA